MTNKRGSRARGSSRSARRAARTLATTAALLSAACASAPRNPVLDKYPAGVLGHTSVLYYDVHGRTFDDVRADMRRLGPKVGSTTFFGETRSPMRWSWHTEATSRATCTIRDVSVSVNAQITLPRWTPVTDAEPGLAAEWTRFIAALEKHEAGHKDISARAATEIIDRLRGLSGPCSDLGTRANDIARVIVERASDSQKNYDAATRHGTTQGTTFGAGRFRAAALDPSAPLTLLVSARPGTMRGDLSASPDAAWAALSAAYGASNLTINAADTAARAAGDSMHVRGTVGTIPVSEIVDCNAPPAVPNADSVDVALFLTSRVEPGQPVGSTVTNTLQAVAFPAGAAPVACRSRGVLERRVFEALRGQLAR